MNAPTTPPPTESPRLAPPGAGIPRFSRWAARYLFLPRAFRRPWDEATTHYRRQLEAIRALAESTPADLRANPALVRPLRGLEDSSRRWSVQMTLEHLVIVGDGMAGMIVTLAAGGTPPVVVDTAAVKPLGVEPWNTTWDRFLRMAANQPREIDARIAADGGDRASRATHPHPWFGPFTAHQWHWMLGIHASIHRTQIIEIRRALGCR